MDNDSEANRAAAGLALIAVFFLALPAIVIGAASIVGLWAVLPSCWLKSKIGPKLSTAAGTSFIASGIVVGVILLLHVPYLLFLNGDFDHTILGVYYHKVWPVYQQCGTWAGHGIAWACDALYRVAGGSPQAG
jgi:hypothetical protein